MEGRNFIEAIKQGKTFIRKDIGNPNIKKMVISHHEGRDGLGWAVHSKHSTFAGRDAVYNVLLKNPDIQEG